MSFLLGKASLEERDDLEKHLASCTGCSNRLSQIESETQTSAGEGTGAERVRSADMPERLGRYRLVRELGAGGMGVVYLAEDDKLQRRVAIKVPFLGEGPNSDTIRERFLREARTAAQVRHPHLCPVHDVGEDDGRPFVVLEYIEGKTLAEVVSRGPTADLPDAIRMMRQVAEAVHVLHLAGIVHRDLKPANILLSEDASGECQPIVTDFGLARCFEETGNSGTTQTGSVLGTPSYMAPEQAAGELDRIGPASDVWAIGVMLYQLATGKQPFSAPSTMAVLDKVRHDEPTPVAELRSDCPEALVGVVSRCLKKSPADRYPTASDLAEALRALENRDSASPSATQVEREPTEPRTMPAWGWLGLVVVVLVGLGLWVWNPFGGDASAPPKPRGDGSTGGGARAEFEGDIDLILFESASKNPDKFEPAATRQGLRMWQEDALPLSPRDWMRIEAELDRDAYLHFVWVDTAGKASPLYPWEGYDWARLPKQQKPRRRWQTPDGTDAIGPLTEGPPGVEAVVMLVRTKPLTEEENAKLPALFADLPRTNRTSPSFAVWLENGGRVSDEVNRGPIRPELAASSQDPELQIRKLMSDVESIFPYSRAVLFGNRGKK